MYHELNIPNVIVNTYILYVEKNTPEHERDDWWLDFHKETTNPGL